ncbi:MAG: IS110 family transposase [Proteobacteria bacterium]|nr:IS110 family transposase [Pseudomonadota bacterium]MBS0592008.1 IS110 family transposase [Pseudomonadota bacterium]
MSQPKSVVGLDVHATQTHACVLSPETGELSTRRLNGPPRLAVLDHLDELPRPLIAVYEAGPIGYGLARGAAERGLDVRVCAPGSIPRAPNDKIKTDRRDAGRLARLLLAGELSFVRVPTPEEEAFRDLARAREAVRVDLMRARHRLSKFLLRRELRWEGPRRTWTQLHWEWLRSIRFEDVASDAVLADYLNAVLQLEQRRTAAEARIEEHWASSPWAPTIAGLRCMKGINTLSALGLCSEAGDLRRFERPTALSAYFGLVPREYSSGDQFRRGPITKAGSSHARRLLVEAAQQYRHRPAVGELLKRRQKGADPRACEIAWRAQHRLYGRWRRLRLERGKPANTTVMAMARELGCFVWEVGQLD